MNLDRRKLEFARRYHESVRNNLSEENRILVDKVNAAGTIGGAEQSFMDANVNALEAFVAVYGRDPLEGDGMTEEDNSVFNEGMAFAAKFGFAREWDGAEPELKPIFAIQDGPDFYLFDSESNPEPCGVLNAPYDFCNGDINQARKAREWFTAQRPDVPLR